METITVRFPHLIDLIFDQINNQSLANCKIVSKAWSIYIGNQKFYAIRNIKETIKNSRQLSTPWFEVFKKANTNNILELRNCVAKFHGDRTLRERFNKGFTPLHIIAGVGNIFLY